MQSFAIPILLFWMCSNSYAKGQEVTYLEIENDQQKLNASCPYDTCKEGRTSDSLSSRPCQCEAICVQLGTCCQDSLHRFTPPPKIRPACRTLNYKDSYFMVDRCPWTRDNIVNGWESLCQKEWNGEDDILNFLPVTSLFTLITYKNYYCFRCHEATDKFYYWNVRIENDYYDFDKINHVSLKYNHYYNTWVVPVDEVDVPVNIKIEPPEKLGSLQITCEPNVISQCSNKWSDKYVNDKCEAYMALIYIERNEMTLKYKNAYCALCNFEDLKNMFCPFPKVVAFGAKKPFSFTFLLDFNPSDGDKVGKIQKCDENFVWDRFASTCRKLVCAIPGYVVKDGNCVPSHRA